MGEWIGEGQWESSGGQLTGSWGDSWGTTYLSFGRKIGNGHISTHFLADGKSPHHARHLQYFAAWMFPTPSARDSR